MQNSQQFRKLVIYNLLPVTVCLSLFTCSASAFAESSVNAVKNANKLYKSKKYDNALKEYNKALTKSPDSAIINFNIGAAQYKKGDYEKALNSFTKALTSENRKLEAKANYNIGNCKYKQAALKENTDLASAVSLLRDSLDYYKRAIELDEESKDAKFNHEFVEKKLKVLLDKLKKQKEQQKQEKKQESRDKEQKNNKEKQQNSTGQQKQKGEKESKSNKKEEQKQTRKEQQKDFGKKEQKQGNEPQKQKAEKSKEMSAQEAKMLLEGYKHEEESKDKLKRIRPQGYYPEVLKDW